MSDTLVENHFAFGENWQSFLNVVDQERVDLARKSMAQLLPTDDLSGKQVIDIGCGSGLSALAMLSLGASHVTCVDIDPNSIAATRKLLETHAKPGTWSAEVSSVFDLPDRKYDIVHSWGVLHHTGDMWRAIDKAASLVSEDGLFALAIYRKTRLCGFWRHEKRFYMKAPKLVQATMRGVYIAAYAVGLTAIGRNPFKSFDRYKDLRGMSLRHDVHDWMGGYPYESASGDEIKVHLSGFKCLWDNARPIPVGIFGSGCDEYRLRKRAECD